MSSAQVTSRYVQANGLNFHVLESGREHSELVIFLHGFPEYSGMWREYLEAMGSSFHAVAPDLRGYNLTSCPSKKEDYSISVLLEDVKCLVKELGHSTAVVIAHDWGGIIAWHVLARYPEIFVKGVIINAPHPTIYAELFSHDPDQKKRASYVGLFRLPFSHLLLRFNDFALLKKGVFGTAKKPFTPKEQEGYVEVWRRSIKFQLYYYKENSGQGFSRNFGFER
ncbi:MAG: alpha/beta hydrolase, partial [Proteobacteria bacterium]